MEALIEQCTSEKNTQDQWDLILRICEEHGTKEPKTCLKSISKRIFHKNPNVSLRAITLLDACSKNCGKPFNREIASRDFTQTVKSRFTHLQRIPSVKLAEVFEKWAEEFKSDSELALAASLYNWVKTEHYDVIRHILEDRQAIKAGSARQAAAQLKAKEEEELAKAIALSLKETGGSRSTEPAPARTAQPSTTTATTAQSSTAKSSLYPEFTLPRKQAASAKGRVRALYDFEAAEDNELTFKAGELIVLLDDSDENWWRGSNHRGEGLFPAQFVKREGEGSPVSPKKDTNATPAEAVKIHSPVQLDGKKLDECLRLISLVDPTGEFRPDPPELPQLEAECNAMAPLVDPELEKVDKRVMMLSDLNQRLLDAFQMYHDLMSQPPPISTSYYGTSGYPTGTASGYMPSMGPYGHPQSTTGGMPYGVPLQAPVGVPYSGTTPESAYPGHVVSSGQYPPPGTGQPMSSVQYPPPTYYSSTTNQPTDPNSATATGQPQMQQQQQHYAVSDVYPAAYPPQYSASPIRTDQTDPSQGGISSHYPGTVDSTAPNPYYYGYGGAVDSTPMDPSRHNNSSTMVASTEHPMG